MKTPPKYKKSNHQWHHFDHSRPDPYHWLRDDTRKNPKILAALKAENQYLDNHLAHTKALQDDLFKEMVGRIKKDDSSVPFEIEGYWYWTRFEGKSEYPILCRKKGSLEDPDELVEDVLNCNNLASGQTFFDLGGWESTDDQRYIAYSTDTVGRRRYILQILDTKTHECLSDRIEDVSSFAWAEGNDYLFYVKKHPKTLLPYQVYRHQVGTPVDQDVLIYEENDQLYHTDIHRTRSRKYLVIGINSFTTSELRLIPAADPLSKPKVFLPRTEGHEYHFDHIEGAFYVVSNQEAENFKLFKVPEKDISRKAWQELIPHRPEVMISDVLVLQDYLVTLQRADGLLKIHVMDHQGNNAYYLDFEEAVYSTGLGANPNIESSKLRLTYTSLTTPETVLDIDLKTGQRTKLKQQEVIGDFDSEHYQSERIWVDARDGAKVPVSLVYHKDHPPSATTPLYQYGYGSYGLTIDPSFSSHRLSLLNRGITFAIAHIRGSQAMGRPWYHAGKLKNKRNTFNDFIDVTRFLGKNQQCDPNNVIAVGGSAGGMLMGVIVNEAPELYRGVVAHVPFVDVVTTMLDEELPLTVGEYVEWGNPNQKEFYDYMLSYSPFDNIKKQSYPAILATTGLHDSQVQYWEPAKWVAKLRDHQTGASPILLHTDLDVGHGGKSGRFKQYWDIVLEYAFILDVTNKRHDHRV